MEDVIVPGGDMDLEFIENNPEAIFDFITIKSIQERYGKIEPQRVTSGDTYRSKNEAVYQNEAEFETFVQQFPIDDSIAECFAAANGNVTTKPEEQFVSGGKRPQGATKYSKLKKKFGWKGADDTSLLSEEEGRSRESKRSKKGGGVFSKRHKWRNFGHGALSSSSKKSVNFSDNSEKSGSENTSDLAGTGRHFRTRSDDVILTDSFSISDSQITSFSETLARQDHMDQTVPAHYERIPTHLPTNHHMRSLETNIYKGTHRHPSPLQHVELNDTIAGLLAGDSSEVMQRIEDLQPVEVLRIRDLHGNNLLHRSVLQGRSDVIKYILENLPEMTSEMNAENETAIELAARNGKYDCLKVILERNQRRKSLGVSLVNRLLNVCAQYGQADCLVLILSYMSRDADGIYTLPGDTRGNTAAHLAAKYGHLHCLQALVAAGCDVMSENLMQQRPLHVAHQSRSQGCFEYLLLLNICEELLTSLRTQVQINMRLNEQLTSVKPSLEHIRQCITRYRDMCSETSHLMTENKISILQTLNDLQDELRRFVQHTSMDTATKRKEARQKIDELRAEVERLEDTFEFSPLAQLDGALSKLISPLNDVIGSQGDDVRIGDFENLTREENCCILSSLIRDIHKESMLENWETSGIYSKYLKRDQINNEMEGQQSPTNRTDSPMTYMTHADIIQNAGENNTEADDLSGSEHTEYANINHALTGTVKVETKSDEDDIDDNNIDKGAVREELPNFLEDLPKNNDKKSEIANKHLLECTNSGDKDRSVEVEKRLDDLNNFETYNSTNTTESNIGNICVHGNAWKLDKRNDDVELREDTKIENPTERPFTKLLSLDEKIDLLIAGERERERNSDSDRLPSSNESKDSTIGLGSLQTSTFTSITSDTSVNSDWYSKHGFPSLETTSSDDITYDVTSDTTASYWWDIGDDRNGADAREFKRSMPYGNDIKRKIHLNLENDESSYDELREQRLRSHLRAVHQSRYPSNHYRERITTSTGEVIGGFHKPADDERVLVDVNSALKERRFHQPMTKPRKREDSKLFTLDDAIATKPLSESEFRDRYDRSHGSSGQPNLRWEDMSITDDEDRGSLAWSRDIESSGSQTPQSYV